MSVIFMAFNAFSVASPKQLTSRLAPAINAGVPVSNYGLTLAYVNGIFDRSMKIFNL